MGRGQPCGRGVVGVRPGPEPVPVGLGQYGVQQGTPQPLAPRRRVDDQAQVVADQEGERVVLLPASYSSGVVAQRQQGRLVQRGDSVLQLRGRDDVGDPVGGAHVAAEDWSSVASRVADCLAASVAGSTKR